ncbi:MAG: prepilin-type N-terminal cleavage/methylation domain-containing protein [Tissierellia bacterium]|nr:prepilin-type N-terminal cleavage/methylation domain-containing protein [Tissierellia bacterium]
MKMIKGISSKYGYTLLELMVVLALFAIVFSISIPSIRSVLINREKKELMTFRRDIIFARNSAIVENTNYTLNIYINKNSYQIVRHGKKNETIKNVTFENDIKIISNNFSSSLRFTPTGAPNKAGTIRLTNKKGDNIEISITPATGKVNLSIKSK